MLHSTPKWLIAEDVACEKWFIIHTQYPRFIAEILDDPDEPDGSLIGQIYGGAFEWIDKPKSPDPKGLAKLMREAGEALFEYDRINDQKAKEAEDGEG